MAKDYAEKILQAADIISNARIESLEYDRTIVARITDNKNAARGEYTVVDGDAVYIAYTDNSEYDVDDYVYVTIPQGNYTSQKMIVGKYLENQHSSYYKYTSPWKKFIDVTGDVLDDATLNINSCSILANHPKTTAKIIWEKTDIEAGEEYTSIGLSAGFRTVLSSLGTAFGTFGLRLYVTYKNANTSGTGNNYHAVRFELTNIDMYGNPYDFETYYTQNKIFDISGLGIITGLKLVLFQGENFKTGDGLDVAWQENQIPFADNIFVNNLYVALGYNLEDFDHDTVLLYTSESKTYSSSSTNEENLKNLKVRWIHKDLDTKEISCYDSLESLVGFGRTHWYKYNLKKGISDKWAGNFWEEITSAQGLLTLEVQPNLTKQSEIYKVLIESPIQDTLLNEISSEAEVADITKELHDAESAFYSAEESLVQRPTQQNEIIYAQAKKNLAYIQEKFDNITSKYLTDLHFYESNILTLENENPVADLATMDMIQGLNIICDSEGYNGVYYLYDSSNKITNSAEAKKHRLLEAKYNSINAGEDILSTAQEITWLFPIANTMIEPPVNGVEYSRNDTIEEQNGYYYIHRTVADTGTISRALGGYTNINATQVFRIKDHYVANATNNVILCIVERDGVKYQASCEIFFGPTGTNGTDYTFLLKMPSATHSLAANNTDVIEVTASLLDNNNLYVDLSNYVITYDWYSRDRSREVIFCDSDGKALTSSESYQATGNNNHKCYIRCRDMESVPYYTILHAQITQTNTTSQGEVIGTVILDAFLPIAFSADRILYNHIAGEDRIIYNTAGTCEYYHRGKYELYTSDDEQIIDAIWSIETEEDQGLSFTPLITEDGQLIPTSSYIDGVNKRIAIVAKDKKNNILWIQPLLLYKDVYSSVLLNSWDGKFSIDEENSTIMSTMLGAGYKDSQNRYNGVLIGEVQTVADGYAGTGVYGYNEGEQSFGLNIDGTAFFGKAGHGRIEMDGNSGTIKSSSYGYNYGGMLLDLDDGYIDIQGKAIHSSIKNPADDDSESSGGDNDPLPVLPEGRTLMPQVQSRALLVQNSDEQTNKPSQYKKTLDLIVKYQDLQTQALDIIVDENQHYSFGNTTLIKAEEDYKYYSNVLIILNRCKFVLDPLNILYTEINEYSEDANIQYYIRNSAQPNEKAPDAYIAADPELTKTKEAFEHAGQIFYNKTERGYNDLLADDEIISLCTEYNIRLSAIYLTTKELNTDVLNDGNTKYSQIWVSSVSPYLSIKSGTENNSELLRISDEAYFLRSDDYIPTKYIQDENNDWVIDLQQAGSGFGMDLLSGKIDFHNFVINNTNTTERYNGSFMRLSSDGVIDPYFWIQYRDSVKDADGNPGQSDLVYIGLQKFYFQSPNWYEDASDLTKSHGIKLDFMNNTLTAYDGFNLYGYNSGTIYNPNTRQYTLDPDINKRAHAGSYIHLSSSGNPYFIINYSYSPEGGTKYYKNEGDRYTLNSITTKLVDIATDKFILQSSNFDLYAKNGNNYYKQGTQIDLENGLITSYQFKLDAKHTTNATESIIINSTGSGNLSKTLNNTSLSINEIKTKNPLFIGSDSIFFTVGWNGEVRMEKIYAQTGGMIGPFNISNTSLFTAAYGSDTGIFLSNGDGSNSGLFSAKHGGNGIEIDNHGNLLLTGSIYLGGTIYGENWTLHGQYTSSGGGGGSGVASLGGSGGSSLGGWIVEPDGSGGRLYHGADIILDPAGNITMSNTGYIAIGENRFESNIAGAGIFATHQAILSGDTVLLRGLTKTWTYGAFEIGSSGLISMTTDGKIRAKNYEGLTYYGSTQAPNYQGKNGEHAQLGKLAFKDEVKKKFNIKFSNGTMEYTFTDSWSDKKTVSYTAYSTGRCPCGLKGCTSTVITGSWTESETVSASYEKKHTLTIVNSYEVTLEGSDTPSTDDIILNINSANSGDGGSMS